MKCSAAFCTAGAAWRSTRSSTSGTTMLPGTLSCARYRCRSRRRSISCGRCRLRSSTTPTIGCSPRRCGG
uniref:Putative secreted protein n=1 Tax=Anopheles darlingi TaxID=43151 RepID=A0A2M4DPT2_ANODA